MVIDDDILVCKKYNRGDFSISINNFSNTKALISIFENIILSIIHRKICELITEYTLLQ